MKKILCGLAAVAVLFPLNSIAQGVYLGASIGETELDISSEDKADLAAVGVSVDDDDTGFKVFVGYRFNDHVALEGFYTDLGEVSASDSFDSVTVESDTVGLSVVGLLPLTPNFELFGKVGFHAWEADLSSTFGVSGSDDGTDATYGVGFGYRFQQWGVQAEYERYELDDEDVDMISAGLVLHF